jgi:hypothetical protein
MILLESLIKEYASEHEGEIPDDIDQKLDEISTSAEDKIHSIVLLIKNHEASATAIKTEEKRLESRRRFHDNLVDRLKKIVYDTWYGKSLSWSDSELHWRKSTRCVVTNPDLVPEEYVETVRRVKVSDIKSDIKNGKSINFAEIQTFLNPIIR